MLDISSHLDQSKVNKILSYATAVENGAEKALHRALKSTRSKALTTLSRAIRDEVNLKKSYVLSKISFTNPSFSNPSFVIRTKKRGVLMTHYPYRKMRDGSIKVRIKRGGKPKKIRGAFIIERLKNSKKPGIAVRIGKGRGDIEVLHSPSVSQVMNTLITEKEGIKQELADYFTDRVEKEVVNILKRGK